MENMIAVIKTGGKQYKVQEGDILKIEKVSQKENETFELADILGGKKVTVKVIGEEKMPKIVVLKFHAKKHYKRVMGHRQNVTKIKIEKIA